MKILRIQFRNLNSLPEGDIDFERPPLAEAGLFAITGPTGSGKSTLLDAITLALYGRAARYENSPRPYDMMSRRAGSCSAEVTFEVRGGQRYRAEWQLRRARNRPDGNFQAATRRLYDAGGAVLAQTITEADRQVEAITGLTYDRFLRSVLLAQGQFAQFFKAAENERARLLESLTGTQIFAELSELAYREATDREQQLARKADLLGSHTFFTPEERTQKQTETEQLALRLTALQQERDALRTRFERGQRLVELRREEALLCEQQQTLAAEQASAAPARERLARHHAGEAFHPALREWDALAEQQRSAEAEQREMVASATAAQWELAVATVTIQEVARRELDRKRSELTRLEARQQEIARQQAEMIARLEQQPAHAELENALPSLLDRLSRLQHLRSGVAERLEDQTTLAAKREKARALAATLADQIAQAHVAVAKSEARLEELTNAVANLRKGRSDDQLLAHRRKLERTRERLTELRALLIERDADAREAQTLVDQEAALVQESEVAATQIGETEKEASQQAHILDLARKNLSLLERMAGMEDQRAMLEPGQPCPLCGSLEHPTAHGAELSREIEDARRRLETADSAYTIALKEAQLAKTHLQAMRGALSELQRRRGELRRKQTTGHERLTELARPLRVYTMESLEEAHTTNEQQRGEWEELWNQMRVAGENRNQAELEFTRQKAALDQLLASQQSNATALEEMEAQHTGLERELTTRREAIAKLENDLATALAPFALAVPPPDREAALRVELEKRLQHDRQLRQQQTTLEQAAHQAVEKARHLQQSLDHSSTQAAPLFALAVESSLAPSEVLLAEWPSLAEALPALESLRARERTLREQATRKQRTLQRLTESHRKAEAALIAALEPSPFATPAALRESLLSPAEFQQISRELQSLAERVQAVAAKLEQLREQARALATPGAGEGSALAELAELAELAQAAEQAVLDAARQKATLDAGIAEDERRRAEHGAQLASLEAEREKLSGWLRLRAMIGSADGDKFRRFAQGLSLDLLLRHANAHLARLTDRYRLRRPEGSELGLEIVDLHQAGVARPTSSLSGGESFLASLAMALGLSDLAGRNVRIDSLFIDEGFGTLDPDTLDIALAALDTLRGENKMVGVISHVALLKERIPVQIRVEKQAGGESRLRVVVG